MRFKISFLFHFLRFSQQPYVGDAEIIVNVFLIFEFDQWDWCGFFNLNILSDYWNSCNCIISPIGKNVWLRKCRKEMKRIQGCKIQISLSLPVLLLSFSHLPNGGNGSIYYKCVFMLWSSSVKALVLFHLDISIWSLQYLPFMYVFFFFIGAISLEPFMYAEMGAFIINVSLCFDLHLWKL